MSSRTILKNTRTTGLTAGFVAVMFLSPASLFAQTIGAFFVRITDIVNITVPVVVGLGLLFFLVNSGKLIFHAGDEDVRREQTKKAVLWGIIILFVMVSVWGILEIAFTTLFG